MITIHKHPIPFDCDFFELALPAGALFLSLQTQGNTPVAWFLVDTGAEEEAIKFAIRGTGADCGDLNEEGWKYLGTSLLDGGQLSFHLFGYSATNTTIEPNAIEESGDAESR